MAVGPILGLDIGAFQMKAVEMHVGKEGLTVTALALAPTPQGALQGGVLTDAPFLGKAVRQMLKEAGFVKIEVSVVSRDEESPHLQTIFATGVK